MKNIIIMPLAIALLTAGCAKKPGGSMQSSSFVASAGLANVADIGMIVYQPAGFGHLPMPQRMPLRSKPMLITASPDITAIFNAVSQPDGKAQTREARNNRLAFIGRKGQIVMYGITTPTIYGCDIAREQSSEKLGPALTTALKRAKVVKLTLTSPVQSVSYHNAGTVTRAVAVENQALQELLGQYSPLVLKGNRRCIADEIQRQIQKTPRCLSVKLTKPDAFDAIVITEESEWPPKVYDANARLERVEFDTITIFSEGNGLARFVFTDTRSNECLFTDPVRSLRLVKEAQGRNLPVYGPDLFDEVVSEIKKQ